MAVHYHMFKNAGTSVDRALRVVFGPAWQEFDSGDRKTMSADELGKYIEHHPDTAIVSSHTAVLPEPQVKGVQVVSIVFVRHPLDRLRSAYQFERQQQVDTPGANAAKEYDLAGYVRWRLDRADKFKDRSATSFQSHRLAMGSSSGTLLERSLSTVDRLAFVGLVEAYDKSLSRLEGILTAAFGAIKLPRYQDNLQRKTNTSLEERLGQLADDLGRDLYRELVRSNAEDLILWEYVRSSYLPY